MNKEVYGIVPINLGLLNIDLVEYMYYLYMPIKLPNDVFKLEPRLEIFKQFIDECISYEEFNIQKVSSKYIYLTINHRISDVGYNHNRPGWHSDGFGTNDINYIWYNNTPTEFCLQQYNNVPEKDSESLEYFDKESKIDNIITYDNCNILRLNQYSVHRIGYKKEFGPRLFIKLSISDKLYNLKGNSINYLLGNMYDMHERKPYRNTP